MSTLRRFDTRASDRNRFAMGGAVRQMAPKQTTTARVLGKHANVIGRICRGQVPSEFSRVADHITEAVRNGLDVAPLLVEMLTTAERARAELVDTDALVAEWWELTQREPHAEAEESWAVTAPHFDALASATADKAEAAIQIRRAAITEVLDERGVDPRTWEGGR